jgi:hypothetical protein
LCVFALFYIEFYHFTCGKIRISDFDDDDNMMMSFFFFFFFPYTNPSKTLNWRPFPPIFSPFPPQNLSKLPKNALKITENGPQTAEIRYKKRPPGEDQIPLIMARFDLEMARALQDRVAHSARIEGRLEGYRHVDRCVFGGFLIGKVVFLTRKMVFLRGFLGVFEGIL